jgi:hypothetical protein
MNTAKMMTGPEVQSALGMSHMSIYNMRASKELKEQRETKTSRNVFYEPRDVVTVAKARGITLSLKDCQKIMAARETTKPGPKPAKKAAAKKAPAKKAQAKTTVATKATKAKPAAKKATKPTAKTKKAVAKKATVKAPDANTQPSRVVLKDGE